MFDDLLKFLAGFDAFKKEVTPEHLSKNTTDKLFICIFIVKTNLDRNIFTAVTTKKNCRRVTFVKRLYLNLRDDDN